MTLYPVFLAVLGIGFNSLLLYGTFSAVLPIIIFSMSAVTNIEDVNLKVGEALGLSRRQKLTQIVFLVVLPGLVSGLRLGFSAAFVSIVVGELFALRRWARARTTEPTPAGRYP